MSWEFHPARETFAQYAADWDRLNSELYRSHPYYDSRFIGPLLKHFGSSRELLCLHRDEGRIRGALLLRPLGVGRWASFRPAQAQITPILVANAGLLKNLLKALPGFAWSIDFYAIDPRYAPSFSYISGETIISSHAQMIGVESGIGFEAYWNHRPKNLRSNIHRYYNRLAREADTSEFSCSNASDAMIDGVRRFGELEIAGWKAVAGTAVSIDSIQGRFYAEVLASFCATGHGKIYELRIDGQLAASRLSISNESMLLILKTTYRESLARFAPSRLLLHRILEQNLQEHPEKVLEFYANTTKDQSEWATFNQNIQNIQLFRNDIFVACFSCLKVLKQRFRDGLVAHQVADSMHFNLQIDTFLSVEDLISEGGAHDRFSPRDTIEESLKWFDLLQKQIYPDDHGVRYYCATDQGGQVAVLPVRQAKHDGVCALESLSNYYTSLYSPLMGDECDPQVLRFLLSAATRENPGAHLMRFAPMDPESPIYTSLLNELRATGWIPMTFFCFGNWFLKIEAGWDDYLRKRSANLRSTFKRMNNKFAAEGGSLQIVSDTTELEQGIAAFQEVYSASWKKPEPYLDFVPSLIRLIASEGMLRLGIARIGDKPIAAQLWITGKGKASIYKVAYHEAYSSYSPGTVLTGFLMQHAIEHDHVAEIDFLIGDDKYKQIWMSHRRERWGIIAFNTRTLVGWALMTKELGGRVAKSYIRKLAALLSNVKARASELIGPRAS